MALERVGSHIALCKASNAAGEPTGASLGHHRLLIDPRRDGEKIGTVAYDCGFGDVSYFNRAFRRSYGAAPSDIRAQARQAAPAV